MMYVLAVEEDGYMRDVTARYAKQYSAKVSKVQSGGRGRREWWAQVVRTVARPYRLVRKPGFTLFPESHGLRR
jgi:xeroderma pigmentosum group C-complementing protein